MSRNIDLILTRFNNWDDDVERDEYIDKLESLIEEFNEGARLGNPVVPDSIYDTCMDYLRELNPDSYLLHEVWSADDTGVSLDVDMDTHLIKYPMLSIQTIKSAKDKAIMDFRNKLPVYPIQVIASVKENGHGIRIVYDDGKLVKANSRGRSTAGKDLTKQMKVILGDYCEGLKELGVVEVRAEVVLSFDNLDKARGYNGSIKSAFSGVASMIRESATEDETKLLDIVAYDILTDKMGYKLLSDKFMFLDKCGFIVPEFFVCDISRGTFENDIENVIIEMDTRCTDYAYHTDGVVVAIDDLHTFDEFGAEDNYRLGNIALKMGRWKQDNYVGIVDRIEWVNGKSKKTPVAILEEGVLTATGNTVTNIPLYAPCYILMLEAYPGNAIHFRYGGEAGVIPVTQDGRLVTDKSFKEEKMW